VILRAVPRQEVNRKLLHGLVIILPLSVFYGPYLFGLERDSLAFIAFLLFLVSSLVELLRLGNHSFGKWFYSAFGSMLRDEERKSLTGATYVAGATFLCAWLSTISEEFAACACLSLTLFILGDAAAALIGKSIGSIFIGKKTVEGAIGCFVLCIFLAYWAFPMLPLFLLTWGGEISFFQASIVGLSIALLELFPAKLGRFKLNDNLYVPVVVTYISVMIR
jgi:dolichol kinase